MPDARWIPRESWHLTLKFLGDVSEDRLADVIGLAARVDVGPFDAVLSSCGAFPSPRRARVLWAGVNDDPAGSASEIAGALESAAGTAGLRQEGRAFTAHITVGRVRGYVDAREALGMASDSRFESFPVEEFALFSSRLSPKGATHNLIERFPLARR